jgi:hypothetical protein
MIHRILFTAGFLAISILTFGKPLTIKGFINDYEKGTPVSFANIAIVESGKGTTSNNDGYFELEIDSVNISQTLNISCLSYENKRISIADLKINNINKIKLRSVSYSLPEIVINNKSENSRKKSIELNKLKRSKINGLLTCDNLPKIFARYFNCKNSCFDYKISELKIGFQEHQIKGKSKVRIRILTRGELNNGPGKDILQENLIVYVKKGINKIDVSKYDIHMPQEGIFIAVEWLIIEENEFEWDYIDTNEKKCTDILYGPILGANYRQKSQTWLYWAGEWKKHDREVPSVHRKIKPGSHFDAAISLTLTNN